MECLGDLYLTLKCKREGQHPINRVFNESGQRKQEGVEPVGRSLFDAATHELHDHDGVFTISPRFRDIAATLGCYA